MAGGELRRVIGRTTPSAAAPRPSARVPDRPQPRWLAMRAEVPPWLYAGVAGSSFLAVLAVWAVASYGEWASGLFLPTPTRVVAKAVELTKSGVLGYDLWVSNLRILAGFVLATLVAVPLGMLAGNVRVCEAALEPLIGFVRYMPVPAFIPLLILYTGIGEAPKVLVIFIGTVVQETVMIADVTKSVPADLLKASIALGAKPREVFARVIWPASLPGIFEVARINLGFAWTYLVVAELIAANDGLGFRILKSQRFLQTDTIFLYLVIIGALGVASDLLFRLAGRKLFPWAGEMLRP
jgi:NitT/TauT family transport system permease protein